MGIKEDLAKVKEEVNNVVDGKAPSEEADTLPEGASPIEASAKTPEVEASASEALEEEAAPEGDKKKTGSFKIGSEIFDTQEEAFAYAERLEREKAEADAYNQGIRDTLSASSASGANAAAVEPEDNFEERFYADPKGTLKEIEEKAVAKALQTIEATNARERMWNEFLGEFPDVRRKDAERVLAENWDSIGKMTDYAKAKKALANAVRSEYAEIIERAKPRSEMPDKRQTSAASGGTKPGVTQQKKNDAPIDFVAQMKKLKERG
jgi:hypothetical protein